MNWIDAEPVGDTQEKLDFYTITTDGKYRYSHSLIRERESG